MTTKLALRHEMARGGGREEAGYIYVHEMVDSKTSTLTCESLEVSMKDDSGQQVTKLSHTS